MIVIIILYVELKIHSLVLYFAIYIWILYIYEDILKSWKPKYKHNISPTQWNPSKKRWPLPFTSNMVYWPKVGIPLLHNSYRIFYLNFVWWAKMTNAHGYSCTLYIFMVYAIINYCSGHCQHGCLKGGAIISLTISHYLEANNYCTICWHSLSDTF